MPAYTRPETGLVVTLYRNGESPEQAHAMDSQRAAAAATTMIVARLALYPGDVIIVRRADEPGAHPLTLGGEL
jgi:hypothetical protein